MAGHYPHNTATGLHYWQQVHLHSTRGSRSVQCQKGMVTQQHSTAQRSHVENALL
jgi:hypothetical protein